MAAASARRLYMFLGGTFFAGGGLIAAACTTDNGTTTNVPTVNDSGRETGSSSGGSSGGSSGSSGETEGGADCGSVPKPKSSDGVFCFGANADAGADASPNKTCASADNEICCSGNPLDGGTFEKSECVVATEDLPGYEVGSCSATTQQEWHCLESSHCPGNTAVCCAIKSDAGSPQAQQDKDFPGCDVFFTSGRFVGGTRCEATQCAAGELQLCSSDADCKAGTCKPITISGRYTGVCKL